MGRQRYWTQTQAKWLQHLPLQNQFLCKSMRRTKRNAVKFRKRLLGRATMSSASLRQQVSDRHEAERTLLIRISFKRRSELASRSFMRWIICLSLEPKKGNAMSAVCRKASSCNWPCRCRWQKQEVEATSVVQIARPRIQSSDALVGV